MRYGIKELLIGLCMFVGSYGLTVLLIEFMLRIKKDEKKTSNNGDRPRDEYRFPRF